MSELKPCPFCGKVDDLYSIPRYLQVTKEETKEIEWAVGCKRCDVHLYRARYAKDDGIATWNTRPIEDALSMRVKELEFALARRDEIIARLKEDGERLVSHALWVGKFLGIKDCIFCGMRAKGKAEIEHTSLCPITLHRALMKELAEC